MANWLAPAMLAFVIIGGGFSSSAWAWGPNAQKSIAMQRIIPKMI